MKNVLKALLRKNQLTNDPTDYKAQVIVKGNMGMSEIVDELIKDGLTIDKETILDILSQYNRKSANLALSGYNVNNGLVNMRSFIKGSLYQGKWNPNANWVDVSVSHGPELYQAVARTNVEIIGDKGKIIFSTFEFTPVLLENEFGRVEFPFEKPLHVQSYLMAKIIASLRGEGVAPSTGKSAARTNFVLDKMVKEFYNR